MQNSEYTIINQAIDLHSIKKTQTAKDLLVKYEKDTASSAEVYFYLATFSEFLSDFEGSTRYLKLAVQAEPEREIFWIKLISCF